MHKAFVAALLMVEVMGQIEYGDFARPGQNRLSESNRETASNTFKSNLREADSELLRDVIENLIIIQRADDNYLAGKIFSRVLPQWYPRQSHN